MKLEENNVRTQSEWEAEERNSMAYRSQPAAEPDQGVFQSLECNNTMHMGYAYKGDLLETGCLYAI